MIKKTKKEKVISTRIDEETYRKLKKMDLDISKTIRAYLETLTS